MRPYFIRAIAISVAMLGSTLAPARSEAGARQLHGGPFLGGGYGDGAQGGVFGTLGLSGAYGINDTFRVYGNLQYGLGAGNAANTPRHSGDLALGLAYSLDVLRYIPWLGVGFQFGLVGTPAVTGVIALPALEVRVGVDYLRSRYFGFTAQFAYGFVIANHDATGSVFTLSVGLLFARDM